MAHTAVLTIARGKIQAQCSCGAQSKRVRYPDGMIAIRVWRLVHRWL